MIGSVVSHYKIVEKLGEGGMGVVYRARDLELDRFVALKFLPSNMTGDEDQQRFIREAKAVSSLDHPNVCTIYEIGRTPSGQLFIAMACYEGTTLKTLLQRGTIALEKALSYSVQIACGLARTHEAGVTHRDLKPANVIITRHDEAKILDFGLAKLAHSTGLTRTGSTMGTISYMSPEQARGLKVDHRTDIWSLGVVMYEMLTSERPFKGDFDQAVIYSILNSPEPRLTDLNPAVPQPLARLVHRTLLKDQNKRFATMGHLLAALEPLKVELSGDSLTSAPTVRVAVKKRKRPWIAAAVAGVLVPLLGLLVIFGRPSGDDARDTAIVDHDVAREATDGNRTQTNVDKVTPPVTPKETPPDVVARQAPVQTQAPPKLPGAPSTEEPGVALEPKAANPPPVVSAAPDLAGEADRARDALQEAKTELDRAAGGETTARIVDIAAAAESEKQAEQSMASADYAQASAQFREATKLYRSAANAASRTLEDAREGALSQRHVVESMRAGMPEDMAVFASYQEGRTAEQDGERAFDTGRYVTALSSYQSAAEKYTAAEVTRQKNVADIKDLVARYRAAIEAEDLGAMDALHTDFTKEMRNGWSTFFHDVGNLRAQLTVGSIGFETARAIAQVTARFTYSGAGGGKTHQWDMIVSQRDGHWLIAEVETKP